MLSMKYISTRDNENSVTATLGIIQGIAKDGGLFVPEKFPTLDYKELLNKGYKEVAAKVLELFLNDFSRDEIEEIIENAYGSKFSKEEIVPIVKVGDVNFIELFHGPTLAFKDMALTLLPYLMKYSLKKNNIDKEVVILTATSGDTGKAALEGFKDIDGVKVIVFYPYGGVSEIQRLQMVTQMGKNTFSIGIKGNFDDAQTGVKKIFSDDEFINKLEEEGYLLSSANSINIGRLIPQIVYYVYGYLNLVASGEINTGDSINIAVPTGNFGNILAAYYSMRIGIPINRLLCASNDNNVLTDFFKTKVYDKNRNLLLTSSPSMDILVSSNLERFLYHMLEDDKEISKLMSNLNNDGKFIIKSDIDIIYGGYANEEEISRTIRNLYKDYDYIIDPHTAVSYSVYREYVKNTNDKTPVLIASTASPFKFSNKVLSSLDAVISNNEFHNLEKLSNLMKRDIPTQLSELKVLEEKHNKVCEVEKMKDEIERILGGEYYV